MNVAERISAAMEHEKGYVRFSNLPDLCAQVPMPTFEHCFLGTRTHAGSVTSLAVVRGDGLTPEDVDAQAQAFHRLVAALLPFAGQLKVGALGGMTTFVPPVPPTGEKPEPNDGGWGAVKLGSLGVMCYVYERGCDSRVVEMVRAQRHGTVRGKDYVRCWVVDALDRKLIAHRGLPLGMYPGKRYLRSLLKRSA